MPFADQDDVVEAFASNGADHPARHTHCDCLERFAHDERRVPRSVPCGRFGRGCIFGQRRSWLPTTPESL
jgi:hypothetical protein